MRRREFIAGLGGAVALPLTARAQQRAMPVVGILTIDPPGTYESAEFFDALGTVGFGDGRNVAVEYHWANGDNRQFAPLAADLVRRRVDVIVVHTAAGALAAKAATTSIPIIFLIGGDPVQLGLVASMDRPGGNITGVSGLSNVLTAKRLEILTELVPQAQTIAFLVNPTNPNIQSDTQDVQKAVQQIRRQLLVVTASNDRELDTAFAAIVARKATVLLVAADALLHGLLRDQIVALAARYAVPAIYDVSSCVTAGGLISYNTVVSESYRLAGAYVGRILKGEKPTDLPVIQPTKFELFINLKTAKELGLTVPPTLLARADEVIE